MNNTCLTELTGEESSRVEGGSFAYDAGRVVRFVGISLGESYLMAIGDWIGTSVMNGTL